jgi:hypothetical protein
MIDVSCERARRETDTLSPYQYKKKYAGIADKNVKMHM